MANQSTTEHQPTSENIVTPEEIDALNQDLHTLTQQLFPDGQSQTKTYVREDGEEIRVARTGAVQGTLVNPASAGRLEVTVTGVKEDSANFPYGVKQRVIWSALDPDAPQQESDQPLRVADFRAPLGGPEGRMAPIPRADIPFVSEPTADLYQTVHGALAFATSQAQLPN